MRHSILSCLAGALLALGCTDRPQELQLPLERGFDGPASRVANPFLGATMYVDPDQAKRVEGGMSAASSGLRRAMGVVRSQPTAVWLDRIAHIEPTAGGMGLRQHLDQALAQQAVSDTPWKPVVLTVVLYDLPNRDCSAAASNGELRLEEGGLERYKRDYVDRIVSELSADSAYRKLRIVAIVEPDALPNLVTNLETHPACRVAAPGYREGVAYAVSRLAALDHVYSYLDIAHSGWLGWDNAARAATIYKEVLDAAGGPRSVRGFATNVANYSSLHEPFDPYSDVERHKGVIEGFYGWNRVLDEHRFVDVLRSHFPLHGFIVDTSRNGWRDRPGLPRDRRTHKGNWCNVDGAGIGERPRAAPRPGIDAYLWVKPPGASDGTSDRSQRVANAEGKRFDEMCGVDPVVRTHSKGEAIPTDALDGAPHAGDWFPSQFEMLVRNATPPL